MQVSEPDGDSGLGSQTTASSDRDIAGSDTDSDTEADSDTDSQTADSRDTGLFVFISICTASFMDPQPLELFLACTSIHCLYKLPYISR